MNLAFYTPNYPGITQDGGIGSYTRSLGQSLTQLGHTVHVITPGQGAKSMDGPVHVHQVHLRHVPILDRAMPGFGNCWFLSRAMKKLVNHHEIDLVEFPNWEGLGIMFKGPWKKKVPKVVRLHTSSLETIMIDNLQMNRFLRWDVKREHIQARQADMLITHSEEHRRLMCEELKIEPEKITLIPHGVEVFPDFVRPPRPPGPPRVVFLGRLEKRKGTLELLQALVEVLCQHPGTTLTLIGTDRAHCPPLPGGVARTHAQWIADELPAEVRQQITLAGRLPQEEVDRHLQTADVFVAPSRYESFGLIYPEAMRWGIPVIGCTVGGVPEIITNDVTGVLVPPESPIELAKAINSLLSDEARRARLGQAGREHIEAHFSAETMARSVEANFEWLLASCVKGN